MYTLTIIHLPQYKVDLPKHVSLCINNYYPFIQQNKVDLPKPVALCITNYYPFTSIQRLFA